MFKGKIFEDSKTYDILKKLASPILPAISVFLFAAQQIFSSNGFEKLGFWLGIVAALIAAAASCLGKICEESSRVYWAAQQSGGDEVPEEMEE